VSEATPQAAQSADREAFSAGVREAFNLVGPMLAEHLLKADGKPVPKGDAAKVDAAGSLFSIAEAATLAVANDPYSSMMSGLTQGGIGALRPSLLGWNTLARMAATPLMAAIIKVLLDQISEFTRPSDDDYSPGFRVRLRNRRQGGTPASAAMCRELERFVMQTGTVRDRRELLTRVTFTDLTGACMRDSLVYDQSCIETIIGASERPARFKMVDASTIRLSQQALSPYGLPDDDYTTPRYVQVIREEPVAEFAPTELYFGVRNRLTSIYQCGYGVSELEMLITIITAWLNAFNRNDRYFKQGFGGRGFMVNKGADITHNQQLTAMKSQMQDMLVGVDGSHRIGLLQGDFEFMTLGNDVQDQQWSEWQNLQVKIACALYGVEPASINHLFGNQGQSSAMGTARQSEREDTTRKRGLIPKVRAWMGWVDTAIIQQIDDDFELVPTGIQTDEAGTLELDAKRLVFSTFNEVRARYDLPSRPDGDVIGSSVGIQAAQMAQAEDAAPDEEAETLDVGSLFGDATPDDRSPAEADDAGQGDHVEIDEGPLQASRRSVASRVRRLVLEL
jgi:hypothetical protein